MLASLLTFSAAIAALISGTRAAPVDKPTPTVKRDVWVPKILVPNAETKWVLGTRYNVTWDTSDAPANITNSKGMVTFDIGGQIVPSGEYGSLGAFYSTRRCASDCGADVVVTLCLQMTLSRTTSISLRVGSPSPLQTISDAMRK